jgi:hypothetical protein
VEELPVDRRRQLNHWWLAVVLAFCLLLVLGAAAMLWPRGRPKGMVDVGKLTDIHRQLRQDDLPISKQDGAFFLVPYPTPGRGDPYHGIAQRGIMAISTDAVHPRDFVVFCVTSGWFEDQINGSKFNIHGEVMPGSPAPTGLWRHPIEVTEEERVLVDTTVTVGRPPRGPDTGERPAGPYCMQPAGRDRIAHG